MKILHLKKINFLHSISYFIITVLLLAQFLPGQAQSNTSNLFRQDTTSAIEERLVQLAWQGPEVERVAHQSKIDEYELKAAQNMWMNLMAFNINYNEFTFSKNTPVTTYVYPRYNLGITIPLGSLFSRTAIRSAKENVDIGKNNMELIKRTLREEVLTAYKQYIAFGQLIAIQSELVNDVKTQLAQIEEKFRSGTISIDAYNNAQKNNNLEAAALVNLKLQQDLKKLELEKLIGVRLESVLKK
jgi:outer membrane protein TolC